MGEGPAGEVEGPGGLRLADLDARPAKAQRLGFLVLQLKEEDIEHPYSC